MKTSLSIAEKLESIVSTANVCAATAQDAIAGVQPEYIVSPGTEQELAAVLACANEAGIGVIPRGGSTKLEWGNPPTRAGIILSMSRLNRVLEHAWADLTVVVEAGCTLKALQDVLAQHGQRLAIDVLCPERATVGGVLSTNDSGALRLRYGALRDLIIGVTLALPDGTLAAREDAAISNLRSLEDAIQTYRRAFGKLPDTLAQLGPAPKDQISPDQASLVSEALAAGNDDGYRFRYRIASGTQEDETAFELAALPDDYGKSGRRSFFVDTAGKIHGADKHGDLASADDPAIP
jgi:type II secretory pathway pseudopilin PulG